MCIVLFAISFALLTSAGFVHSAIGDEPLLRSCALPEPSVAAQVIAIGVKQPSILSTVTLGDDDSVIRVLRVHVEEGDQPLFVLAATDEPVIFSVSGAAERLERFVTFGTYNSVRNAPLVGVAGIAAEKVTPIAGLDWAQDQERRRGTDYRLVFCGPSASWVAGQKNTNLGNLFPRFSRKVDGAAGTAVASDVYIPSGRVEGDSREPIPYPSPSSGYRRQIEAEMQQEWRGGIQALDPANVVSAHPVKSYDTLPGGAGILQLLDRGALQPVGEQIVTIIGLDKSLDGQGLVIPDKPRISESARPRAYRIMKTMRFPAGLTGRWDFTFCLPKGTPMPDGRPGASTVVEEGTGQVLLDRGNPGEGRKPEMCSP